MIKSVSLCINPSSVLKILSLSTHTILLILHLAKFICEIEDIRIVEGHVMPITTEYDQVFLKDHSRMAISRRRSLPLYVENLCVSSLRLAHHG